MRNVTVKSMTLTNFKGHKNRTISFSETTNIYGKNATGKSTIFDAFIWLLFGKDQFDRKDYEILPKGLDRVDAEVSALLDVDGRIFTLKRVLHPKWVRRRGTAEEVYDGNETLFYIDDVPLKASEYKARVDMIIDETIFKLITNPAYFLSLNWTKQREILFQMAGTLSDAEIAATKAEFASLLNELSGKSFKAYKTELLARKKKLKDDLELIPSRIDQTQRLMPEQRDVNTIEKELAEVDLQITKIENSIADRSEAIRAQYEAVEEKQKTINSLKNQQQVIVFSANEKAKNEAFIVNQARQDIHNSLRIATQKLDDLKYGKLTRENQIAMLKKDVDKENADIAKLRQEWNDQNAIEYKAQDGCLICPVFNITCSDAQAASKHAEAQEKAKMAFFEAKENKLEEISERGRLLAKVIEEQKERIADAEAIMQEDIKAIAESETEIAKLNKQLEDTPIITPAAIVAENLQEWKELEERIKDIQATIEEVKPVNNADLIEKKKGLSVRRDELKEILSKQALIPQYQQEIKSLESKASDLAQQIADLEKQEFIIAEFTKARVEESEARINSMFRIVKFQLFDKTIDGNEFECCIPTNLSGVPISATNNAERINAGLDIINTLCSFNNVTAPIFCDNRESVNDIVSMNSQIINLIVTNDPELIIN